MPAAFKRLAHILVTAPAVETPANKAEQFTSRLIQIKAQAGHSRPGRASSESGQLRQPPKAEVSSGH